MKLSLCNEVVRHLTFPAQCEFVAALGYDALEIAPFTLSEAPHQLPAAERRRVRQEAEQAGVAISGLHFLLLAPPGLTLTGADSEARARTKAVIIELVNLCAELGGRYVVHGSPQQRTVPPGASMPEARAYAKDILAAAAEAAERAGVVYCLEALAPQETNFINTVAEAAELVSEIGSPALQTMIDTCAAGRGETQPIADLARQWIPTGLVRHIHVNDRNRRGPGQGEDRFADFFRALVETGYSGVVGVEPFDYHPDPDTCAARAIGYLRGIEEAMARVG
jgi:D-psicose/D-tagatose/L-ribulose 3-epimerase